jgi:hypothetical protein
LKEGDRVKKGQAVGRIDVSQSATALAAPAAAPARMRVTASKSLPLPVTNSVVLPTHRWFGLCAVNCQPRRLGATGWS